ncbi:transcriptional regulator [Epidermidibacterium keratini]|uniref:Transcriptional regulator n=1 Tax=Epidermidibacterium keratini TaxID=1891644 RepID=A0A7L4YQ41_9ACTN|nr:LCP family protein [Epidermidibacterium keratini]QHC01391.1 transcriptional regulator [Epidermidibacterium keratini]
MPRSRLPRSRRIRILLSILVVVLGLLIADAVVLSNRITDVDVSMPAVDDDLQTWVIVGSDGRGSIPDGASQDQFGSTEQVEGERADLILVVVESDAGTRVLSIPRDMLVTVDGYPERVGLRLLDGPDALVGTLCTNFGIPADHYLQLGFGGFAALVDTLGGIEVDLPNPVRDPVAGLDLQTAGTQTIDGATALALVRSRNAEELIDGQWVPTADGITDRTSWGGLVLRALGDAVRAERWNPIALQRLAWQLTGELVTDSNTGIFELAGLDTNLGQITELPHEPPAIEVGPGQAVPLAPNEDTDSTLRELGFTAEC